MYRDVRGERTHVPFDRAVYVGDGGSDMPVFSLLHDRRRSTLAVYKAERAEGRSGQPEMPAGRRVQNLAPADFSRGPG